MRQDIIEFPNSSNSPDFIYKIDSLKKFQDNILKPYLERENPEYQWTDSTCDITPTKASYIKKMSPLLKKKEDVPATDSIVFNVVNMTNLLLFFLLPALAVYLFYFGSPDAIMIWEEGGIIGKTVHTLFIIFSYFILLCFVSPIALFVGKVAHEFLDKSKDLAQYKRDKDFYNKIEVVDIAKLQDIGETVGNTPFYHEMLNCKNCCAQVINILEDISLLPYGDSVDTSQLEKAYDDYIDLILFTAANRNVMSEHLLNDYVECMYQKMRTVLFEVEKLKDVDGDYKNLIHKAHREAEEIDQSIKQDDQDRMDDLVASMRDPFDC